MTDISQIPELTAAIRRSWPVGEESLAALAAVIDRCDFGKRQLLVRAGAALGYAYFIEKGMTRSYWIVDGEEITTSFSIEGAIVFSMDELYYGRLSEEYVETVEPVTAYAIAIGDLLRIMESDLDMANWGRVIHQHEYRRLHRSHKERLTLPAHERYAAFAGQFPQVCRRARLSDIASYLGVTPSTLSRIRSCRN